DVVVAAECAAVRKVHRPVEHVAGSVRPPQVSDAVVSAGDVHPRRSQYPDRRDGKVVDGGGGDGDPCFGQPVRQPPLIVLGSLAKAVGVAHSDAALQAESGRSVADELNLPGTEAAAVMQVNIDLAAVTV